MSSLYRERILEHYNQPRNQGAVPEPDLEAVKENPHCGDRLHLTASLKEEGKALDRVRFEGEGCALSIAAASLLTGELERMSRDEVKNIAGEHMFALLGLERDAVSPMRHACVLLARDAAREMVDQ